MTHFEVLVISVLITIINVINIPKSGARKLVHQVGVLATKPEFDLSTHVMVKGEN